MLVVGTRPPTYRSTQIIDNTRADRGVSFARLRDAREPSIQERARRRYRKKEDSLIRHMPISVASTGLVRRRLRDRVR